MDKDKLVTEMLTAKAEKDNIIDLNAYGNGLTDMYDKLVNLCNLPVSNLVCNTHGTKLYKHPNGLAYCSLCNYIIKWQTCY